MIADHPWIARVREEFNPAVRIHHHGRHYVIYRIEPPDDVLILAVLHDAMDLARHL